MSNSEKFKAAFKAIIEEIRAELKDEDIKSVEFELEPDEDKARDLLHDDKRSPGAKMILNGICRWDPIRRRIVCRP
jgi:hypothetical protein